MQQSRFECLDAFGTIPAQFTTERRKLSLTADELDDPNDIQFVSASKQEMFDYYMGTEPLPHPSWQMTEDQKYNLFMALTTAYGVKHCYGAFNMIYGHDKNTIMAKAYRNRHWTYHGHGPAQMGPQVWDLAYKAPMPDDSTHSNGNGKKPTVPAENWKDAGDGKQIAYVGDGADSKCLMREAPKADEKAPVKLPPITTLAEMDADITLVLKPDLWSGIVRQGDTLFVGGASKSNKTWWLLNLAIAVATGKPFLGRPTLKCKVLFIEFEVRAASLLKRTREIAHAMGISIEDFGANFHCLNLRGYAASIDTIKQQIIDKAGQEYGLVIFDPAYKCLGSRNENDAGQMNDFCNELEAIGEKTKATLAVSFHFAKGNASGKNAQDRMSGSGVLARHPDAIITLTPHKEEDALTASVIVRDHPPVDEFVVRWEKPLFRPDMQLDPKDLKAPNGADSKDITDANVVEAIGSKQLTTDGIIDVLKGEYGVGINRARDAFNHAKTHGMIEERSRNRHQAGRPSIYYGLSSAGKKLWQRPYSAENQAIEDAQAAQEADNAADCSPKPTCGTNRNEPEKDPFADM